MMIRSRIVSAPPPRAAGIRTAAYNPFNHTTLYFSALLPLDPQLLYHRCESRFLEINNTSHYDYKSS